MFTDAYLATLGTLAAIATTGGLSAAVWAAGRRLGTSRPLLHARALRSRRRAPR